VGAYATTNNMEDVWWALGFGLLGYIFKMYDIQVGPIILGIILGPLLDTSYRRAMMAAHNNIWTFFANFFSSPISIALVIFLFIMFYQSIKFESIPIFL